MSTEIKIERNQDWKRNRDQANCRISGTAYVHLYDYSASECTEMVLFQFEKEQPDKIFCLNRSSFLEEFTMEVWTPPEKKPELFVELKELMDEGVFQQSNGSKSWAEIKGVGWSKKLDMTLADLSSRSQLETPEEREHWRQAALYSARFLAFVAPTESTYRNLITCFARSCIFLDGKETYHAIKNIVLKTSSYNEELLMGLYGHHGVFGVIVNRMSQDLRDQLREDIKHCLPKEKSWRHGLYDSLKEPYKW